MAKLKLIKSPHDMVYIRYSNKTKSELAAVHNKCYAAFSRYNNNSQKEKEHGNSNWNV